MARCRFSGHSTASASAAPTDVSPHRLVGARSINHVAVPAFWAVASVERVSAIVDGVELSDHDAYVVEIE